MKKIFKIVAVFAVFMLCSAEAKAQFQPAVIGVVDLIKIQNEAVVFKDLNRQRDIWITKYREEVKKEEEKLKKMQADLDEMRKDKDIQKDAAKVESYNQKVAELNKAVMDSTMMARARGEAVSEAVKEALTKIQSDYLNQIIADNAQKNGVNVVMSGTQVLFYEEKIDMTATIMTELNKKVTSVKMPDPKINAPAAAK